MRAAVGKRVIVLSVLAIAALVVPGTPAARASSPGEGEGEGAGVSKSQPRARWQDGLTTAALLSFIGEPARVMVVAAGPRHDEAEAVAAFVVERLRESGVLPEVLDTAAMGDTAGLYNHEILARALFIPVERVVVVRVVQDTLYFDTYTLDGSRYAGFALARGTTLSPHVDAQASASARRQLFEPAWAETSASQLAAHNLSHNEREYLDLELGSWPNGDVVRGMLNTKLDGAAALELMGAEQLLARERRRRRARAALAISGFVVGSGFLFAGAAGALWARDAEPYVAPLAGISIGLGFALHLSATASLFIRPSYDASDIGREVKHYNHELRRHLGLPEDIEERMHERSRAASQRKRASWTLAPQLGPRGFGLQWGAWF